MTDHRDRTGPWSGRKLLAARVVVVAWVAVMAVVVLVVAIAAIA